MRPAGLDGIKDCVIGFWDKLGGFFIYEKRDLTLRKLGDICFGSSHR